MKRAWWCERSRFRRLTQARPDIKRGREELKPRPDQAGEISGCVFLQITQVKTIVSASVLCSIMAVNLLTKLKTCFASKAEPEHLRRGKLGERAAKKFLQKQGMKFITANFRSERGEIDLIFRERSRKGISRIFIGNGTDCLVFAEVKTRSSENWTRPAAAVDARKRKLLSQTALDYLKLLKNPPVKFRFDIVEVLLADGQVREIRHLPNTFSLSRPHRYA